MSAMLGARELRKWMMALAIKTENNALDFRNGLGDRMRVAAEYAE